MFRPRTAASSSVASGSLASSLRSSMQARAGHGRVVAARRRTRHRQEQAGRRASRARRDDGLRVLWGRAWEDAGAPPYWPWVQAFRALIRSAPGADHGASFARARGPGPDAARAARRVPGSSAHPRRRTQKPPAFSCSTRRLRFCATLRPAPDSCSSSTISTPPTRLQSCCLRFLASQLGGHLACSSIGTYRDLELTPEHPLTGAIAEMARERTTRLMMLGGLGSDAVSDYITAATNVRPDGITVAAVWRETNGNPLFVGEAFRLLEAEGRLGDVADLASLRVAVPAGVQAVIARRIGHLGRRRRCRARCRAVIGPEFQFEILRRTSRA